MVIPPLSKSLPSARPVAGRTALLNCVETCYVDTDHDTWIKIVVALMYSYISIAIVGSRHSVLLSVLRYQWFSTRTKL